MWKMMLCCCVALVTVACASAQTYDAAPAEQNARADDTYFEDEAEAASRSSLSGLTEAPLHDAELRIQRNGWIRVDAGDELRSSTKLRRMAKSFDAIVMNFNTSSVTFKMPSEKLESLINKLDATEGWEIDELDFSAWDRTGEFFAVDARIRTKTAIKERMMALLETAQTVNEVLQIGQKVDSVQVELDQLKAQEFDINLRAGRVEVTVMFD